MLKAALFTASLANASLVGDLVQEGYSTGKPHLQQSNSGRGFTTYLPVNAKIATCLKQNGFNTALIRAYANGAPDNNGCDSLNYSMAGGIYYRDAVISPCYSCSTSAQAQVEAAVSYLRTNCYGSWSGNLWVQV